MYSPYFRNKKVEEGVEKLMKAWQSKVESRTADFARVLVLEEKPNCSEWNGKERIRESILATARIIE